MGPPGWTTAGRASHVRRQGLGCSVRASPFSWLLLTALRRRSRFVPATAAMDPSMITPEMMAFAQQQMANMSPEQLVRLPPADLARSFPRQRGIVLSGVACWFPLRPPASSPGGPNAKARSPPRRIRVAADVEPRGGYPSLHRRHRGGVRRCELEASQSRRLGRALRLAAIRCPHSRWCVTVAPRSAAARRKGSSSPRRRLTRSVCMNSSASFLTPSCHLTASSEHDARRRRCKRWRRAWAAGWGCLQEPPSR